MPRLIDFGQPHGVVSFPDDATDEQVASAYYSVQPKPPEPSAGDYLRQAAGSVVRGVGDTLASIPEGLQTLREAIPSVLPDALKPLGRIVTRTPLDIAEELTGGAIPSTKRLLRGTGEAVRGASRDIAGAGVPGLEDSFAATKLPRGIGSALAFIAGGAAGATLKIPQWLSIAGLGSAAGGQEFYEDAKASGADERTAHIASLIGNVVGTSEALPLSRMMNRLDGISGGTFSKAVIASGRDTLEEALQEASQQLAQNATARKLYDKDRDLIQGVAEGAGVGGATGFLLSAVTQALGGKVGRRLRRSEQQTRTEVTPVEEEKEKANEVLMESRSPAGQPLPETRFSITEPRGLLYIDQEKGHQVTISPSLKEPGKVQLTEFLKGRDGQLSPFGDYTFDTIDEARTALEGKQIAPSKTGNYQLVDTRLSAAPIQRIPIQIQSADGTVREGEFTGYYDLTQLGRGFVPSVGWTLPDGNKTHGMLKPDEQIVGDVPTPEQWSQNNYKAERRTDDGSNISQPIGVDAINERLVELGVQPNSSIEVVEDPAATWDAVSRFEGDRFIGIRLNASKIRIREDVDINIEHEASHMADMAGETDEAITKLTPEEKVEVFGTVARLYPDKLEAGDTVQISREFNARSVDALVNSWKGRAWYEKLVGWISDIANRFGIPLSRLGAERAAARAVGKAIKRAYTGQTQESTGQTQDLESRSPSQFTTREQVEQAKKDPLLKPAAKQIIDDLAKVQAGMVNDEFIGWWMADAVDKADKFAKDKLEPVADLRFVSNDIEWLNNLPETTDEQKQAKEVTSAAMLGHYGGHRMLELGINSQLIEDNGAMGGEFAAIIKMNVQKMKAAFLDAMTKHFPADYKKYLSDLTRAGPKGKNLQAQLQSQLVASERNLNEQEQSPTALQKALQAIAVSIPQNLLPNLPAGTPKAQIEQTNQAIIDLVKSNGMLNTVVGDNVKEWLLTNDGAGKPALLGYSRLSNDLRLMKDTLANQDQVLQDIKDFEQWFRPSGKTGKISAKAFAEAYHKFRDGRDNAMKVASEIEKRIDNLDTRIRGNIIAKERLTTLMTSPGYIETVTTAAKQAGAVVSALGDSFGNYQGIIDRGGTAAGATGVWTVNIKGGNSYVVDLNPNSSQETQNQQKLKTAAAEMLLWADANAQTDPLVAAEYIEMAEYITKHLIHPALNPQNGFIRLPWVTIPGSTVRVPYDPFDMLTSIAGGVNFLQMQTLKDVMERIGGRPVLQVMTDLHKLDIVMKTVEGINADPKFGYQAQTASEIKALESHGLGKDQFPEWNEHVIEPIIASHQNNIGAQYEVGDRIVGFGHIITAEDMAAIRLMKEWSDAVLKAAPKHIQDKVGNLQILRKAISAGRYTMPRTAGFWTTSFRNDWAKADTDEAKWSLLSKDTNFKTIIMGMIGEFNREFDLMNSASKKKSPLFNYYRRMAEQEKLGLNVYSDIDTVLDFIANEMVSDGVAETFDAARTSAQNRILSEVKGFVETFYRNLAEEKSSDVWGAVPPAVIDVATANNSFTTPRGSLLAPSTFYAYSTGMEGRRLQHVGSLRSLMNLKVIQSIYETIAALEGKISEYNEITKKAIATGMTERDARLSAYHETSAQRDRSEIRYDYSELQQAVKSLRQIVNALVEFEQGKADWGEHVGVAAMGNVMGTVKSALLSPPQSIVTNTVSGTLLGPAMLHAQTGQAARALQDVFLPAHIGKAIYAKVSDMLVSNPEMHKILTKHKKFFMGFAESVMRNSSDWRRMAEIAHSNGMVSPYNLGLTIKNKRALPYTAGAFRTDMETGYGVMNYIMSAPGIVHVAEGMKAHAPRMYDIFVNYTMIAAYRREMDWLKTMGKLAFARREAEAAASGHDWQDLSNPANVLNPGDLGMKSWKGVHIYRDMFWHLGSMDSVILDYYNRTKGMTDVEAAAEPLIKDDNEDAAMALDYAAKSNVASESNRPPNFRGKGADGVWRGILTTFMGWSSNWAKQISKLLQRHSKDPGFEGTRYVAVITFVLLMAAVGASNWELGDWLTELVTNKSSPRIQPGNIDDYQTGLAYLAQAIPNVVPFIGSTIGSMLGVTFSGRGSPFDMTSQSVWLGMIADTWNTAKRIRDTGDVVLPMADYLRRWFGVIPNATLNRMPTIRGLVDQNNAIRSMLGSAPPGTEIKYGSRGGGNIQYGPANDEIQKLIASAYEAVAHGGSLQAVAQRRQEAIDAFIKSGRSPTDAVKAVDTALAAKEPARVLTGREITPEEAQRWVKRMTTGQKKDYDTAVKAWGILGQITGKNLDMVSSPSRGGGGRSYGIPGIGGSMMPAGMAGAVGVAPAGVSSRSLGVAGPRLRRRGIRRSRIGRIRRTRTMRQPKIGRIRSTRRRRRALIR